MFWLVFARIQTIIHGTSLWIKSLMLIQWVLMFPCPFKFRYFNFKLLLVPFFSHLVVAVVYCSLMVSMPIAKVPTMQEFKPGMPLTKIDACVLKNNEQFFYGIYYSYHQWFSIITQTLHFTALLIFIHFICTILIIWMVRKEIKDISILHVALTGTSKVRKLLNFD